MKRAAANSSDVFDDMAFRLRDRVTNEFERLDEGLDGGSADAEKRMKLLSGFFRLLQGVEEMVGRIEQRRHEKRNRSSDLVELRRELEKRIDALVQGQTDTPVSGGTE